MTTASGVQGTAQVLAPADLERILHRAASLPALGGKYREFLDGAAAPDLTDLPVLTKDELNTALDGILAHARRQSFGSYLYGSGGTTSAPKLSLVPSDMFLPEIVPHWHPLAPDDVLVNMNTPGRLWSSHNFYNALAHQLGAVTVPLGSVEHAQLGEWLDFVERVGATAMDGTPTHIAHLLEYCEEVGRRPPPFRKLLWTGEPFSDRAAGLISRLLPEAGTYGVYGSTETWVIGHNGPDCLRDVFHPLPYQHVEIDDGLVLVTNTHARCLNPVLRYRVGDRGEFVACPCGATPALRVLGRDDPQLKFVSVLITPQEIADVVMADPQVRDVQIALYRYGTPTEHMQVRVVPAGGAVPADELCARLRERVLTCVYRLGWAVSSAPESFDLRVVEALAVNPRTYKTPLLVKEA
jgi:phenylacetate-CoA ligase